MQTCSNAYKMKHKSSSIVEILSKLIQTEHQFLEIEMDWKQRNTYNESNRRNDMNTKQCKWNKIEFDIFATILEEEKTIVVFLLP